MAAPRARTIMFGAMGALVLAFLIFAFRPEPLHVDAGKIERGPIQISITDDGRTRVKELYVVSAPIAGRVLRLDPEVGDRVVAGETLLATMVPSGPAFLDERRQKEAEAAVEAARAALELAQASVAKAEAEVDYARAEIKRTESLVASNTASPAALDRAQLAFRTAAAQLDTAKSSVRMRRADVAVAEAALIGPDRANGTSGGVVQIRAPISGAVLTLNHESEGVVAVGTPLLELGDPQDIEIVADFLSHQAVKVMPGARVMVEGWGGEPLSGHVRLVEPKGFTKFSALGIEEQRVNIIIDFDDASREQLQQLGHGFRVEPRIILWEGQDVLQVPTSALFRKGENWAVFRIVDETALLTEVQVGRMNDRVAELVEGLNEGASVILHPSDVLEDGMTVRIRVE
ncbi:efflux RND transporter periplasmic adaptor subunit [Kordiimonas lacus]|uniref:HlyD family secretion protein n=1 Tax=Kordiimonas lacus TaxID=637679 RepID=A0A1G6YIR4_9PROT|nr:HlyD family efflux transporter periplasmic adaptor subunit [Kordiimonas lacus]SDD90192.1 HlyD family secretion protein [Kordiimonas lacus]